MTGESLPIIRLKTERHSLHPWIYQKMVEKPTHKPKGGAIVDILRPDGEWVGRGFYNGHSQIALRVLTRNPAEAIDEHFFADRIGKAIELRHRSLHLTNTTEAYRVVHSEGDGLSGLVVDRFKDCLVLEFFSAGMYRFREVIQEILSYHFPHSRFFWFMEEYVQKQEAIDCRSPEPPPPLVIREHGVKFWVAPGYKHKTGFFADQRDNRLGIVPFCENRRVLDICCNTGGFALYAKVLGKAAEVVGLDLDEDAIRMARRNAQLNDVKIEWVRVDLFPWLRDAIGRGLHFDLVVLDPSKQTRDRREVEDALKRYVDMNRLAIQAAAPGAVFLTCSCTGLISESDFLGAVRRAARQAGRTTQVFRITGAAPDHPFFIEAPESRYLKAVWTLVM